MENRVNFFFIAVRTSVRCHGIFERSQENVLVLCTRTRTSTESDGICYSRGQCTCTYAQCNFLVRLYPILNGKSTVAIRFLVKSKTQK